MLAFDPTLHGFGSASLQNSSPVFILLLLIRSSALVVASFAALALANIELLLQCGYSALDLCRPRDF